MKREKLKIKWDILKKHFPLNNKKENFRSIFEQNDILEVIYLYFDSFSFLCENFTYVNIRINLIFVYVERNCFFIKLNKSFKNKNIDRFDYFCIKIHIDRSVRI